MAKGDAVQFKVLDQMDTFEFFNVFEANKKYVNG